MPCEILIRATTKPDRPKGQPVALKDTGWTWGTAEGLPEFVILRISDRTAAEVEEYMKPWINKLTHRIVAQNAQGWRIGVSVSEALYFKHPLRAVKAELEKYLENRWGATNFTRTGRDATFDLPKPLLHQVRDGVWEPATLADLKADLIDKAEEQIEQKRFLFPESGVDQLIAAGGFASQTAAQVAAAIRNLDNGD